MLSYYTIIVSYISTIEHSVPPTIKTSHVQYINPRFIWAGRSAILGQLFGGNCYYVYKASEVVFNVYYSTNMIIHGHSLHNFMTHFLPY